MINKEDKEIYNIISKLENQSRLSVDDPKSKLAKILKNNFEDYNFFSFEKIKFEIENHWQNIIKNFKIMEFSIKAAPLLGILGTISGIIQSFIAIGEFSLDKKTLVISGISEALFTTAAGLVIAIITMIFYYIFRWIAKNYFKKYNYFLNLFKAILKDQK